MFVDEAIEIELSFQLKRKDTAAQLGATYMPTTDMRPVRNVSVAEVDVAVNEEVPPEVLVTTSKNLTRGHCYKCGKAGHRRSECTDVGVDLHLVPPVDTSSPLGSRL